MSVLRASARTAMIVFCALLAVPCDVARAEISDALAAVGWEELTFDELDANRWLEIPDGVRVVSENSVSIVFRRLAARLDATPVLRWRWRSRNAPAPTDLTRTRDEDRALALYVGFPYEPDRAGFWESLRRPLVTALQGADAPGRVLTYAWGGTRPRGTLLYRGGSRNVDAIRILRTPDTPLNQWHAEAVDLAADFREAFGWDAPDPTHIGLVSDSDDTGRFIDAEVVGIRYGPR